MLAPRPVGLAWTRTLQKLLPGPDALVTPARQTSAEALSDPVLRKLLGGRELGTWALSPWAIEEVAQQVHRHRPALALEFGSGSSTVVIAHVMRQARGDLRAPWVISVEQDAQQAQETHELLERSGLQDAARIIHAPLVRDAATGHSAYAVGTHSVMAAAGDRPIGFVLIDGPAAEEGSRVTTLRWARSLLRSPTPFALDDAVRDGEIGAAAAWRQEGLVAGLEYRLDEGGLLLGTVVPD